MRLKPGIFKTIIALLVAILLMTGCKDTDSDSIIPNGTYTDNYGGSHTFTDSQWSDAYGSTFAVIKKNEDIITYVIYQNGASNSYNPSKFSRVDFTEDSSNQLYYCQIAYDKNTADEAEAVTTAVRTSPASSGCGSFAWTKLTKS